MRMQLRPQGVGMSSSGNDSGKVVDLQQRQAAQVAQQDRIGDLLKLCRATALKRLAALSGAVFDSLDDALFDLAERGDSNQAQVKYFDGMREVRKKRQLVERLFQEALAKGINQFGSGSAGQSASSAASGESSGLALVDDQELEETLAVSAMAGKAENRLSRALFAIAQRFSVLAGGAKVDEDINPIAPKAICKAFQGTLKELDVDIEVKLIMLKLFDKHVMGGLDALYEEVNQQLIQAGVLPQMKLQAPIARRPGLPTGVPGAPGVPPPGGNEALAAQAGNFGDAAAAAMAAGYPSMGAAPMGAGMPGGGMDPGMYAAASAVHAELQMELYNTVRNLLAARRGGYAGGVGMGAAAGGMGGGAMGPAFATHDLINALSILQSQATSLPLGMPAAAPMAVPAAHIKEELVGQLQKLGSGDEQHRMASADEDTIDLVGMLFEFILQDRNLPAQMQALIARLQIPYLKCAILDKELFASKEHPARVLLDELAQASLSWSEEGDKDGRFLEKMRGVVETLLKDFDDDVSIFNRLLADFRDFVSSGKKRAEVAELRAAEAAKGRERLQTARKTAAKEILSRIEGRKLPDVIRHILTRPWANVLVLTILRQGEGSQQWKSSLRLADELVWSAESKERDSDRQRLEALRPELEKALRQGLAMVAYHENDVQQLLRDLNRVYEQLLNPPAPEASPAAPSVADNADAMPGLEIEEKSAAKAAQASNGEEAFVDEIARQPESDESEPPASEQILDHHYEAAKGLKVGTWVEFHQDDGRQERAKLSWISPISAKYLFVNRKGLKVADKTVWALAAEFRSGRALLLEDVPLFDRALDAIVERLKNAVSQEAASGTNEADDN